MSEIENKLDQAKMLLREVFVLLADKHKDSLVGASEGSIGHEALGLAMQVAALRGKVANAK